MAHWVAVIKATGQVRGEPLFMPSRAGLKGPINGRQLAPIFDIPGHNRTRDWLAAVIEHSRADDGRAS